MLNKQELDDHLELQLAMYVIQGNICGECFTFGRGHQSWCVTQPQPAKISQVTLTDEIITAKHLAKQSIMIQEAFEAEDATYTEEFTQRVTDLIMMYNYE